MVRSLVICIADDPELVQKAKDFGLSANVKVEVYHPAMWSQSLSDAQFRQNLGGETPTLVAGGNVAGGKILQFPTASVTAPGGVVSGEVATINELEAKAIEKAIHTFRGNLTEAAKALGIGRATLYRKVKLYNIDPSSARRKRAA